MGSAFKLEADVSLSLFTDVSLKRRRQGGSEGRGERERGREASGTGFVATSCRKS